MLLGRQDREDHSPGWPHTKKHEALIKKMEGRKGRREERARERREGEGGKEEEGGERERERETKKGTKKERKSELGCGSSE
jgi:hypothetical protein